MAEAKLYARSSIAVPRIALTVIPAVIAVTVMTAVMISTAIIAPTSTVVMAAGHFIIIPSMTMYPTPRTRCAMAMVAMNLFDDGASSGDRASTRQGIRAEASSYRQSGNYDR